MGKRAFGRKTVASGIFFIVFSLRTQASEAHFQGYDSVDDGEIRYDEGTKYDVPLNHAIAVWNERKQVRIVPDNLVNIEDLYFSDIRRTDIPNCGLYDNNSSSDDIYFNIPVLDAADENFRKMCATHELGHALGLAHSIDFNVMDADASPTVETIPQCHDREDYRALWGGPVEPCPFAPK